MDTSFTTAEEARVIIESLQQEVYVLRLQLIKANAALVKGVNVNDLPRSQDCVEKEDFKFTQISRAVEVFKEGKFLIVLDNENRENEGDLIIAAGAMNSDKMAFMINNTRSGIVCCAITPEKQKSLSLPLMVSDTTDRHRTAFTQSVDLLEGTTTGVSASDRSKTVRALADDSKGIECFQRPGHVFPLVASEGGLKKRQGHTEAAVELCRLAGLKEVACLSEIALKNGEMAKRRELEAFSREYNLCIITIDQLIEFTNNQQ